MLLALSLQAGPAEQRDEREPCSCRSAGSTAEVSWAASPSLSIARSSRSCYSCSTTFPCRSPSCGRPIAAATSARCMPARPNFETGRYAIYVLWQPDGVIPWYVLNLLEALKAREVNTIAVANHALTPDAAQRPQSLCAEIVVRGNKGLDFGAYKDAVLHLLQRQQVRPAPGPLQ